MTWTHPGLLALAPGALALVIRLEAARRVRVRALVGAFGRAPGSAHEHARTLLLGTAVVCAVAALAGPRGRDPEAAHAVAPPTGSAAPRAGEAPGVEGRWVVLLMDASRSMATADVAPDRSAIARAAALRIATAAGVGRVGVVAFASDAYVLVPPTTDRALAALHVDGVDPGAVTAQGSDLAAGLSAALDALRQTPVEPVRPAVIVVSDGEGFEEGAALDAQLARAREAGVEVDAVRVGTEEGGAVPGVEGAVSRARPEALARLAEGTGGRAVDASDGPALSALVAGLAGGAPREERALPQGDGASSWWAPWLALAALLALFAETGVDLAARRSFA